MASPRSQTSRLCVRRSSIATSTFASTPTPTRSPDSAQQWAPGDLLTSSASLASQDPLPPSPPARRPQPYLLSSSQSTSRRFTASQARSGCTSRAPAPLSPRKLPRSAGPACLSPQRAHQVHRFHLQYQASCCRYYHLRSDVRACHNPCRPRESLPRRHHGLPQVPSSVLDALRQCMPLPLSKDDMVVLALYTEGDVVPHPTALTASVPTNTLRPLAHRQRIGRALERLRG